MFQLRDPELELVEVGARDQAQLVEDAFEARTGFLAHAERLAPPTAR